MTKKGSKFDAILGAAKGETPAEAETQAPQVAPGQPEPTPAVTEPQKKRGGRPKGKRSDPNYEQVTAYIKKETHQQVKIALLQNGGGQDFSELVDELLVKWLRTQKSKNAKT